jgi:hypothetical protein
VVVEQRGSVAGLDFTLSNLQDCTVFLLGPLAALFIHRLTRCRVYVGPVAGAAFMEGEWVLVIFNTILGSSTHSP